ncbi:hypothetical protein BP6252_08812 [Coleophoma cylindrospora]|uniref:NodB homology domain-containing protein n=1 Tax=Coleophoma cylindrospora TaxID=1849047 RepID=A0A3D8R6X5_9HELO|nr:hypothetical protein BP6252_08812 [Coleophoma cylindrospora]
MIVDPRYDIPRNMEGYGEDSHDPQWPNGVRIAVSFVLNYEEGAERSVEMGDGMSEPYLWEKGASGGFREGARYCNAEGDYEYGSRVGAWRLLRLFKEFGWNWTTYAIAVAMERNPKFAQACVRDGHEIASHGYRWLDLWDLTVEEDKENIKKSVVSLKKTTGVTPCGVYFGRGSPNTRGLFKLAFEEMGEELLWTSEEYNDDVPYWQDAPHEKDLPDAEKKGQLVLPYNYDCNDGKFHMNPG